MIQDLNIGKQIAKGGQKEVFLATHPDYGEVIFKKIFSGHDSFERTKREIRAVSLLNSPHIPKVFSHNCEEENPDFIWIVEEFIPGKTLREFLREGRSFSAQEVVSFLEVMLEITVESERHNLVHRDIKPENIILDDTGKFWLLDFGIARHLDLKSLTATNQPYGVFTLGYASSEQFRNMKRDIDIRTDLFSIGVVSFEMLRGNNFYLTGTDNDPLKILKKLENSSLPILRVSGDPQFLLSTFIRMLGDHRRTRRPRTAKQAKLIFDTLKPTITK